MIMENLDSEIISPEMEVVVPTPSKNSGRTKSSLNFLCCPHCKNNLKLLEDSWSANDYADGILCPDCNREYLKTDGYIDFLPDMVSIYSSKREKIIRSLMARIYSPATNFMFLFCGGAGNARREVLSQLELKDNDVVLETGMGAGENYPMMNSQAKNLRFFGIDVQKQMMTHCTRNINRWQLDVEVFRADAVQLPFRNEMFDVVFHLGAFNLFSNKRKAIEEMIRVARPGARIVIADETEKAGRLFNLFTGNHEKIVPPTDLIPRDMLNIGTAIIWRGFGYLVKFNKPPAGKSGSGNLQY
jgi:ubiquinone/menaquinone biosynthesis C-methylase UbiE/uncharacterized protein YbaR (Trm112 family)